MSLHRVCLLAAWISGCGSLRYGAARYGPFPPVARSESSLERALGEAEIAPGALELDAASACGGLFAGLLQGLWGLSRLEKRGGSLIMSMDSAKGSPRLSSTRYAGSGR